MKASRDQFQGKKKKKSEGSKLQSKGLHLVQHQLPYFYEFQIIVMKVVSQSFQREYSE